VTAENALNARCGHLSAWPASIRAGQPDQRDARAPRLPWRAGLLDGTWPVAGYRTAGVTPQRPRRPRLELRLGRELAVPDQRSSRTGLGLDPPAWPCVPLTWSC